MANWHSYRYNRHWEKLQCPDTWGYITEEEQVPSQAKKLRHSNNISIFCFQDCNTLPKWNNKKRLSGPQHPPKLKYSYKNSHNICFQEPSQIEIFSGNCTKACNQMHWRYCLWLLCFRDTRVPSSPRSRWCFQGTQWPVSRPYLWGGQGHTIPNGPSIQETQTCWYQ